MYVSENGDGDSHSRKNMPILLAGHAGGFKTGRVVAATDKPTGALHASIIKRFGFDVSSYGDPGRLADRGTLIAAPSESLRRSSSAAARSGLDG